MDKIAIGVAGALVMILSIGFVFGFLTNKVLSENVVHTCPVCPVPEKVEMSASVCSACISECSGVVDDAFEMYKKVHGLGAVVASRESLR